MAVRLEVALPACVAFLFGVVTGLTVSHVVAKRNAPDPHPNVAPAAQPDAAPQAAAEEAQLRQMLGVHEKLLAEKPDDASLLRMVGNYHVALQQHSQALELLSRAEAAARAQGLPPDQLAAILVDQGVALADSGELEPSLRTLEQAATLDPADVRSRLAQAYLYLTRIMPNPPPGFDRREAAARADALIDDVLAIDPANADALQFRQLMDSVRRSRQMGDATTQPSASPAAPTPP